MNLKRPMTDEEFEEATKVYRPGFEIIRAGHYDGYCTVVSEPDDTVRHDSDESNEMTEEEIDELGRLFGQRFADWIRKD